MKNRLCFYMFGFMFMLSLLSNVIANDTPLMMFYNKHIYFPAFKTYALRDFGINSDSPFLLGNTESQNIISRSKVIYAPIPYGPHTIDYSQEAPFKPTLRHILGTDDTGRDLFVRLLYGLRISLLFGLLVTFFGSIVGIIIGGVQGYFGNNVDIVVGRFVELWCSLPSLFIVLILSSFLDPSFFLLLGITLMFNWVPLAYITRSEFLRARSLDYVAAAQVLGVSRINIIRRHIFPNTLVAITSYAPFMVNLAIVQLTSLDFLGLGLPSGTPSLGEVLRQAKDNLNAPWIGFDIFFVMAFMLTLLVFIGESLRDYFQVKEKNA